MTDRWHPLCWLWALREESVEGGCTQRWEHCNRKNMKVFYMKNFILSVHNVNYSSILNPNIQVLILATRGKHLLKVFFIHSCYSYREMLVN